MLFLSQTFIAFEPFQLYLFMCMLIQGFTQLKRDLKIPKIWSPTCQVLKLVTSGN